MKMKLIACFIVVFLLAVASGSAFAHHGTEAYNEQAKLNFKGTVVSFEWSNPHCQLHLDVTDAKGNVVHWNFEASPPNVLVHSGWTKDSIKPGDQVTVVGSPAKNGAPIGIIQKVILPNGRELTREIKGGTGQ
jgi:hypothetical protein